ncbi:MAG: methyl-accepting chemotaxis protein, partial [Limnochordales bacterium]
MSKTRSGAWHRRIGITGQIGGGFAVLLLLMAFVAFLGLKAFNDAVASFEEVLEADVRVAIEAQRLEVITGNLIDSVLRYFLPSQVTAEMHEEWLRTYAFLQEHVRSESGQALLADLYESHQEFFEASQVEFAAFMQQERLQGLGARSLELVAQLVAYVEELIAEAERSTREAAALAQMRILAAAAVALVAGVVLAFFITRGLSRPIRRVAEMAGRIAQGDLTVEPVQLRQYDEVGQMAEAFNILAANLRHIIQELDESTVALNERSANLAASSEQAARVTEQIAQTIEQVAAGTGEQSRSVHEVVGIVDELKRAIDRISEGAREQARTVEE